MARSVESEKTLKRGRQIFMTSMPANQLFALLKQDPQDYEVVPGNTNTGVDRDRHFGLMVDLVNADFWVKHCIESIDYDKRVIKLKGDITITYK